MSDARHPGQRTRRLTQAVLCGALAAASLTLAAPAGAQVRIAKFVVSATNQDGTPDVQAGSHPYALTTTFLLQQAGAGTGYLKDATLQLPPGLVGDPDATPRCAYQQFIQARCPDDTAVGAAASYIDRAQAPGQVTPTSAPVYNLVPAHGVAAEFGFIVSEYTPVLLETSVRTGSDYGLTTNVPDVNQATIIGGSKVTIWGDPANPAHNAIRGRCLRIFNKSSTPVNSTGDGLGPGEIQQEGPIGPLESEALLEADEESERIGGCPSQAPEQPLLTNPVACGEARTATLSLDTWEEPTAVSENATMPAISGCSSLKFSSTLGLEPEQHTASTPTGLDVEVNVPQEGTETPAGLAEADARDTTVTLPAGFQLNASSAQGQQACSDAQIGFTGYAELEPAAEPGIRTPQFTPAPAECPNASKIANVQLKSPLLEHELTGSVYLAAPQNDPAGPMENPFRRLIAAYLIAEEPETGVLVKLAGYVELGEPGVSNGLAPGQIRTIFDQTPELPYSSLKLQFFGGERAPVATPGQCGTYSTLAAFSPWSSTVAFLTEAEQQIGPTGPEGQPCTGPLPFTPTLGGESNTITAAAFTPLTTTITRAAGQQTLHNITVTYPPGVSAVLAGVPLCDETQANAGSCPATSLIGQSTATAGLGNDPITVAGGKVYLTEGYEGAPFGLSIVTPAIAGPFNLGNVVVRASIEIDPLTAQVSVRTGEIPTMLRGVPLQIRTVQVTVNRPGFTINPTTCDPLSVNATITGGEGAAHTTSNRFQLAGCPELKFDPRFSASTAAHTSKQLGASLVTRIEEPAGALGTQADIAKVKVQLPKQLPSQLKTLQKACLARTFEVSPAACLAESPHAKVGDAVVHTPLLPVPLTGNAYLVSHGGEAFPSLTLVLKGDNVTIVLVGATDITKGITTTTFKTTPDVPFTSFQLTLPQGEYAALGAYVPNSPTGSLCATKLVMPTEIVAQNGMALYQNTPISVTGCPPSVAITKTSVKTSAIAVTVKLGQGGTLVLSGKGIRKKTIHGAKAGTRTITIPLTATGRAARKHRSKLKITAALTASGHTGTATSTVRA